MTLVHRAYEPPVRTKLLFLGVQVITVDCDVGSDPPMEMATVTHLLRLIQVCFSTTVGHPSSC